MKIKNNSASIYGGPFQIVIFTAGGGYDNEKEGALKDGLIVGQKYFVDSRDVGSSRTSFRVREAFGPQEGRKLFTGWFNSCLFEDPPGFMYGLTNEDIQEMFNAEFPAYGNPTEEDIKAVKTLSKWLAEKNNCRLV